jgi:hypothetical protein
MEAELSAEDGRGHYDFAAFNARGELQLSTWTSAPATFMTERDAYQARLDRGDFAYVTVTRRAERARPAGGHWKMYGRRKARHAD